MPKLPTFLIVLAAAMPAFAAIAPPAGISRSIAAPSNEAPAFMLRGEGVQVFECQLVQGESPRYGWTFAAPEAVLYEGSTPVGRHIGGQMWESTSDRSSVTGTLRGRQDAGANLPWLLLRAFPTGESGLFANVTSIQRVNTAGGVAPAGGCDASRVGSTVQVPFSADYYFYRRVG
jgi:hypothetical protein